MRGQSLAELCEKHGFEFFLAELERQVEGACAGEDNEEGAWQDMYWRSVRNEEPVIESVWVVVKHNVHTSPHAIG